MTTRDIEYRILTKLEDAGLREGTRQLDDLGEAGDDAGRQLDETGRSLEQLGDDARTAAREVDTGFDTIRRASTQTQRTVDGDSDRMRGSLRDVGDEAGDSAREMAASFSGGSGDVIDAFQEIGANAGVAFGPVGLAAGAAMATGLGLLRARAEELQELTKDLTQAMIDAGGKLTEAAINARVQTMATEDPGGFIKYNDAAQRLGISIRDVARARAGDADAAERVQEVVGKLITKQREESDAAGDQIAQRKLNMGGLEGLLQELSLTSEAMTVAAEAAATATESSTTAMGENAAAAGAAWGELGAVMGVPIEGDVKVNTPSPGRLANVRYAMQQGIGPIVVDVYARPRYDQSTFSRYRP